MFLGYKYDNSGGGYRASKAYLINDLDGGVPLENFKYYTEDGQEYFISLIDPIDIKIHVSGNEFKNITPEYPEKKKELEKLAKSQEETDNPVLIMVRLKK